MTSHKSNLRRNLKATLKLLAFVLLALHYFSWGLILYPLYRLFPSYFFPLISTYTHWHAATLANILQLKLVLNSSDEEILKNSKGMLLAANHLSYLDVIALMALSTYRFVTSVEVKKTFFLGHITQMAGCLFVERRNKNNIHDEIREMTESLKRKESVFFFPEATSTNGEAVLRFKIPLFQSAVDSGCPILPIAIRYLSISGNKVTTLNRDIVCWYGDMTFLDHFWQVLREDHIVLGMKTGALIQVEADSNLINLSELAQKTVAGLYHSNRWDTEILNSRSTIERAV
jgi:1-acyl-sn-glycerol-3-phosphate acyltransferase